MTLTIRVSARKVTKIKNITARSPNETPPVYEIIRVDDVRAEGVDLTFDSYPWEAGSTMMHVIVPQWAHDGGPLWTRTTDFSLIRTAL